MNKTEISKQLAEQENKERLASQAFQQSMVRRAEALQLDEISEQVAKLAEALAAMTRETKTALYEMAHSIKSLRGEAESALTQAKRAGHEMEAASTRITWKMGVGMLITSIFAAPVAVSAYSLWQHHYGEEKAQAEAWRSFKVQTQSLTPAEQGKLFKILHWDQGK